MESLNINHKPIKYLTDLSNLIINSNLYKNFILRIYVINNLEYIDKNNLNELTQLFNLYKYKINLNNVNKIYEEVSFNNQSYNLINKHILLNFIKTNNYEIVFLIENISKMKLYPNYTYEIKKFENEIKKLKIEVLHLQKLKKEVEDLKVTINYINNKINKTYESTYIYGDRNTDTNTYSFIFPNLHNT